MDKEYESFLKHAGDFVFVDQKPEKADIIFIPGNGYPQMAEKAAMLYKEGYAPRILPSGKYSVTRGKFTGALAHEELYKGDYHTEWDFISDVLRKNGVPSDAILKENQATYTYANAILSKKVLDESGIVIKKAILCCKTHHTRRCLLYYQKVFPEVQFFVVAVDADGVTRENWRDSKEGVDAVSGEITRILNQFEVMLKQE